MYNIENKERLLLHKTIKKIYGNSADGFWFGIKKMKTEENRQDNRQHTMNRSDTHSFICSLAHLWQIEKHLNEINENKAAKRDFYCFVFFFSFSRK